MRTALTPAPFPPRAALSSLELFLCKGLTYLERISCRVSQGFVRVLVGCGLQPLIPFFSSCMTLPSCYFAFLFFSVISKQVLELRQHQSQAQWMWAETVFLSLGGLVSQVSKWTYGRNRSVHFLVMLKWLVFPWSFLNTGKGYNCKTFHGHALKNFFKNPVLYIKVWMKIGKSAVSSNSLYCPKLNQCGVTGDFSIGLELKSNR